jgi:Spy/CpxP family protein refolding chaperone
MTIKKITLGLGAGLLALTAVAGTYAHAQDQDRPGRPGGSRGFGGPGPGGRFGGPGGPMGMLPMLGRAIDLTDPQKDQIKAIADSHQADWKALADRARTAHGALNAAVMGDTIDEALIRQKSAEVAAVDADLAVARARTKAEVFQILTADQKSKLKTMQAARQQRLTKRQPH